jgi:putative ABC transport system substrate-binding protein
MTPAQYGDALARLGFTQAAASRLLVAKTRISRNLTGVTTLNVELVPKRLELLHELSPTATPLALLVNPTSSGAETVASDTRAAARALGLDLDAVEASSDRHVPELL